MSVLIGNKIDGPDPQTLEDALKTIEDVEDALKTIEDAIASIEPLKSTKRIRYISFPKTGEESIDLGKNQEQPILDDGQRSRCRTP